MSEELHNAEQSKNTDKLVIYLGVDGVCFSADGSKYGKYEKYLDREVAVSLSPDDLDLRIRYLKRLGFEAEKSRTLDIIDGVPPQTFTVVMQSSSVTKEVQFFCRKGLEVPERYLAVLDYHPDSKKPETLKKIIELSRQNHQTLKDLIDAYTKVPTETLRLELMARLKKDHESKNDFINALILVEESANNRGTYHIGSFQRPLPNEIFEKLNNDESIAALNCFVREGCNSDLNEATLYNAMEILAKIGNKESVAALSALAYTTIWGRDRSVADRTIANLTKDGPSADALWKQHSKEWFTESELKRLNEIKALNARKLKEEK
jgi:hypothetical protein